MTSYRDTGGHPRQKKLEEGCIPGTGGILGWNIGGGVRLTDSHPYSKGRWVFMWDRLHGGTM